MKKQIFLLTLILLPMVAKADAVEIDGIYYNLISKIKEAEVTYNPNNYSGDIIIPESIMYNGESYSVVSIGINAFYQCYTLTSVKIPSSVRIINAQAFEMCRALTTIEIPEGVTSIGVSAFGYCRNMTSITVPKSLTVFGSQSFEHCDNLKEVYISSIETWCRITFGDQPLKRNGGLLFLNGVEVTELTLPDNITSIPENAFCGCSSITSVTLQEGFKKIGKRAFEGSNIETLNLPNSLDSICEAAFSRCKKIVSINFPNNLQYIGFGAFADCSGLKSIIFPNSLKYINREICRNCDNLEEIIIPHNIQGIGYYAFKECPNIQNVYCYARDVPQAGVSVFMNSFIEYATLHVPETSVDAYKSADPWKNFKEIVALTDDDPKPDATGINVVRNTEDNKSVIYDLNGVRQSEPKKGINIINGKKVVVK